MLSSIILEKLPPEIKLLITRNMNQDIWDLTQMLEIFNQELKARETCLPSAPVGKNFEFESKYTGSALYSSTASRRQNPTKSPVKCIFCKGEHWSDKCNIVTDPIARKEFLKNNNLCFRCLKKDHLSRNCKRSKTVFIANEVTILLFVRKEKVLLMIHRKLIQKTLLKVLQILRQVFLLCCCKPLILSLKAQHVKNK